MSIYTKTGDSGETSLFGGGRVPKDHPRVAAYGDVDELNAAIGLAAASEPPADGALLQQIQRDLLSIGSILATPAPERVARALAKADFGEDRVTRLEQAIDGLSEELPALATFVLPAGVARAAALHVARTVCRRAERSVVALARMESVPEALTAYLNRLSDLLFMLARAANHRAGRAEQPW
jgi:cob(I)alamin adenosyltransferase